MIVPMVWRRWWRATVITMIIIVMVRLWSRLSCGLFLYWFHDGGMAVATGKSQKRSSYNK
jgi:predicted anti-sigma-YlaC factor YlaD